MFMAKLTICFRKKANVDFSTASQRIGVFGMGTSSTYIINMTVDEYCAPSTMVWACRMPSKQHPRNLLQMGFEIVGGGALCECGAD